MCPLCKDTKLIIIPIREQDKLKHEIEKLAKEKYKVIKFDLTILDPLEIPCPECARERA